MQLGKHFPQARVDALKYYLIEQIRRHDEF